MRGTECSLSLRVLFYSQHVFTLKVPGHPVLGNRPFCTADKMAVRPVEQELKHEIDLNSINLKGKRKQNKKDKEPTGVETVIHLLTPVKPHEWNCTK